MQKPVLYVQQCDNKSLCFDFCYSAKLGAELLGIKVKPFTDIDAVPTNPENIIVGSVEVCQQWLANGNYKIPETIDLFIFKDFLKRNIQVVDIKELTFPCFIKPATEIKAFTGFCADDSKFVSLFSENYEGLVLQQDVLDIVSEYRLYVSKHESRIRGLKHYSGDCLTFPDKNFIIECHQVAQQNLKLDSYTLDFGILENGDTVLIEANDGWAIGNYGLEPEDYYLFVRNRWLQMTGLRK
jgi:hypothetical protein